MQFKAGGWEVEREGPSRWVGGSLVRCGLVVVEVTAASARAKVVSVSTRAFSALCHSNYSFSSTASASL